MLIIDKAEPEKIKLILKDIAKINNLEVGDYLIMTNDLSAIIERKTPTGLLSDLSSGRIFDQLRNMQKVCDIPVLLVEGVYSAGKDGNIITPSITLSWRYSSIENLILYLQLSGFYFARTSSEFSTAMLIRSYYQYLTKEKRNFQLKKEKFFPFPGEIPDQIKLVASLPGINVTLARRLLDKFKTPLSIFNAEIKDLIEVEGIGKVKAETIYSILRTEVKDEKDTLAFKA